MPRRNNAAETNDSHAAIIEMVDAVDTWHKDAHGRLRKEIDAILVTQESNYKYFRGRVEANQGRIEQLALVIEQINRAPVAIDKLVFTPKVVAVIAGTLLSIYGIFEASTYSLKASQDKLASDVSAVKVMLDAKSVMDKARADLEDAQNAAFRNDLNDVKRQMQLLQYDNQALKDLVRKKGS